MRGKARACTGSHQGGGPAGCIRAHARVHKTRPAGLRSGRKRMAGTSALLFPAFHPLDSACHFPEQPLLPVSSQWIISANYSQETPLQRHLAWGKPGRASAASLTALQVEQKSQLCPGFRSLRCSSLQVRWGEGTHPAAATGGGLMDSRAPDPPPRLAGGRRGEGGALARPRAAIFSDRSPRAARSHSPFCPATPPSRSSSLTTPRVPPRPLTVLAARHARVLVRLPPTDPSVRSSSVSLCSAFRHTQS